MIIIVHLGLNVSSCAHNCCYMVDIIIAVTLWQQLAYF